MGCGVRSSGKCSAPVHGRRIVVKVWNQKFAALVSCDDVFDDGVLVACSWETAANRLNHGQPCVSVAAWTLWTKYSEGREEEGRRKRKILGPN